MDELINQLIRLILILIMLQHSNALLSQTMILLASILYDVIILIYYDN